MPWAKSRSGERKTEKESYGQPWPNNALRHDSFSANRPNERSDKVMNFLDQSAIPFTALVRGRISQNGKKREDTEGKGNEKLEGY